MANQFDILRNFNLELNNAVRANVIGMEQAQSIQSKLLAQQISLGDLKKQMYKSDEKWYNMQKHFLSVGRKIYEHNKNIYKIKKNTRLIDSQITTLEKQIAVARRRRNRDEAEILMRQQNQLRLTQEINKVQMSQLKKMTSAGGLLKLAGFGILSAVAGIFGTIFKIGGYIKDKLINLLKQSFNVFLQIQRITGGIGADIGLTNIESRQLLFNMSRLTISASKFGGTMEDVATIFKTFSQSTNRNRIFNEKEIEQLVELGLGTDLGVQGATELAASFDNIGISLGKTIKLTDKARNIAAKFNLNSGKVLRTYNELVTSLTGIGFNRGLSGLTKLAAKATALRFDIAKASESFKDAFFEPEKALDAAAQMQVLGGSFASSFGDPIQLAFESMTNPDVLAEKLLTMVRGKVIKKGGLFTIPPAERKMLMIAADTLGQDYNALTTAAIEQAKSADKISELNKKGLALGFSEADKLAISQLIKMNEDDQYVIKLTNGDEKLLKDLTSSNQLRMLLDARKADEDAAIKRKDLMERLQLIITRFQLGFSSVFTKIFGNSSFDSFLKLVEEGGTKLATFINDKILGSNGLVINFDKLYVRVENFFKRFEEIWVGNGGFLMKVGKTIATAFKDVMRPLVVELFAYIMPLIKAGLGSILRSMEDIPLIGRSLDRSGTRLQQSAFQTKNNALLNELYSDGYRNDILNSNTGGGSTVQGALLGGKIGYNASHFLKHDLSNFKLAKTEGTLGFKNPIVKRTKSGSYKWMGKAFDTSDNIMGRGAAGVMKNAKKVDILKTLALSGKRIPVLGLLASLVLAGYDAFEGDTTGALLNLASGAANLGNLFLPGVGTAVSTAIDVGNMAREMGAFDDGVIYKDGSYAKFSKGDMVQFIDQAAFEKASVNGSGANATTVNHSGTIIIRTDDGKVVTWNQLYGAAGQLAEGINSSIKRMESGYGHNLHPNHNTIKPLI